MAITIQTIWTAEGAQAVNAATTQATSALKALQDQFAQTERATTSTAAAFRQSMMSGLQAITRATQTTARATELMSQQMSAALQKVQTSAAKTSESISTMEKSLLSFVSRFTAGFGLIQLGRSFLEAALSMDAARNSLQAVTGSTAAAGREMTFLQAIAEKTGTAVTTLTTSWVGLFAAASPVPGRLEEARKVFVALAETAPRLGKSSDQVGLALYGLTQLAGGATVQMQELQQQIGDALPGVFPALAREMGITQQSLRELISTGGLLVDDVLPKLERAIRSLAQGDGPVTTAASEFGRMRTAWTNLMDALAQSGALGAAVTVVQSLTKAAQFATQAIKDMRVAMGGGDEETKALLRSAEIHKQMGEIQRLMTRTMETQPPSAEREAGLQKLQSRYEALQAEALATNKVLDQTTAPAAAGLSDAEKRQAALLKYVQDLKKTPAEIRAAIADIDKQLSIVKSGDVTLLKALIGDPNDPQFTQISKAFSTKLLEEREKLQNQLLGIDVKGAAKATKDAETEAKRRAQIDQQAMEDSLKAQEALIAQSFDDRRQIIDAQFAEELRREPLRVKELSDIRSAELQAATVEEARFIEQARIQSLDRQLLTAEEYSAKREAIIKRTGEAELKASQQTLAQQIKDAEELVSLTERVNEQILDRDEKMQAERTRQVERELDQQADAYARFSDQVIGFLDDAFQGLLTGTLDAVDFFKTLLIRQLSQIAANVIGPFIAQMSAGILGGLAGGLPSSLGGAILQTAGLAGAGLGGGGAGQGGPDILGLAGIGLQLRTLFGPTGAIGSAFAGFTAMLDSATADVAGSIADLFGLTQTPASGLTALGGIAGIGGGIFAALTAKNVGGQAGGAIGAAGGAAALAAGLGLGLTPIFGPIGLALAAIAPLLGNLLGSLGAPRGPRFTLGGLGGLGIAGGPGGLQVTGALTSRIGRQERLPGGVDTAAIQDSLTAGVTNLVNGMVEALNKVALRPEELIGPTQKALDDAMRGALTINTSSAKNFEKDVQEQMKFVGVQVSSFFLRPLNEAFRQLESAELDEQISRLPQTVGGMADVFKTMNTQLDELSKVANTDVLRQLSSVRNRVEDFGNALADTARVIAEDIVADTVGKLREQTSTLLDQPLSKQIFGFAALMNQSFGALRALQTAQASLTGVGLETGGLTNQIDTLTTQMLETAAQVSTRIVTGALDQLSVGVGQITAQSVQVQATTVNSLFNDSLAALQALWTEWHNLEAVGLDAGPIQQQFTTLLGGMLDATTKVLDDALMEGSFAEFLDVLESIPEAVTDLNPAFAQLKQLGAIFGAVLDPITARIANFEAAMRTPAESIALMETRMLDLQGAIADAGDSADRALPLYAQLAEAVTATANMQIAAIQALQQAQERALSQIRGDIDTLEASLGSFDQQMARVAGVLTDAMNDFNAAAAAGDTLAQIQAVEDWGKALVDLAHLQIEQSRAVWQAQIDAQQGFVDAIQDSISAQQELIDGIQDSIGAQQEFIGSLEEEIASINELVALRERIQRTTRGEVSATRAAEAIRAEMGMTTNLEKLVDLNEELIALGKSSNQLSLIQEGLDNLTRVEQNLSDQLAGGQALTVAEQALSAAQAQLAVLENDLAVQQGILQGVERDLAVQQGILESVQSSTVSDREVAAIQTQLLSDLRALEQWLIRVEGDTTWEDQILAIQRDAVAQLQQIELRLKDLFLKAVETTGAAGISNNIQNQQLAQLQSIASYNLALPLKVVVGNFYDAPRQRGGLVGMASGLHYAQGGLVPIIAEPGERVFMGATSAQRGALTAMNTAFPRFARGGFTVPGSGTGDSVPLMLPPGSFVLNRSASGMLGHQSGGSVPGQSMSMRRDVIIHVDLRGSTFSKNITLEEFKALMETLQRRGLQR